MKLSKREKVLIVIMILIVFSVLFYKLIYAPGSTKISKLEIELEKNRDQVAALKFKHREAEKYLQQLTDIDNEIRELNRLMPDVRDIPGVMVEFYELLKSNRLEGDTISFGEVTLGEKYDSFTTAFSVKGKRADIDAFLKQLEGRKAELSITNLTLIAEDLENFNMDITIKVYMFKADNKSGYPEDYNFMGGNLGNYGNWYEMFKIVEIENGIDALPGGLNGAEER